MERHLQLHQYLLQRVTTIQNTVKELNPETTGIDLAEAIIESLDQTRQKVCILESKLLEMDIEKECHGHLVEFLEEFERRYVNTNGMVRQLHRLITKKKNIVSQPENIDCTFQSTERLMDSVLKQQIRILDILSENQLSSKIRLPRIDIPKFGGNYAEFLGFWDLFKTAVDENSGYSNAQKLWYLKASLTGEAANLIKYINTEDSNYQIAKNILEKRYSNNDRIAQDYMRLFLSQSSISIPTAENLKQLHDTSNAVVQGLKILKMQSRDVWLIHIVLEKLDFDTRRAWAEQCAMTGTPLSEIEFETLLTFLERRFGTYEFAHSSPEYSNGQTDKKFQPENLLTSNSQIPLENSSKSFVTINTGAKFKCHFCKKGTHSAFNCRTFNHLTVSDRISLVASMDLCKNCLRPAQHKTGKCSTGICSRGCCKKCNSNNHHTLLHYDKYITTSSFGPENYSDSKIQTSTIPSLCLNSTSLTNDISETEKAYNGRQIINHTFHSFSQPGQSLGFKCIKKLDKIKPCNSTTEFQSAIHPNIPFYENVPQNNCSEDSSKLLLHYVLDQKGIEQYPYRYTSSSTNPRFIPVN